MRAQIILLPLLLAQACAAAATPGVDQAAPAAANRMSPLAGLVGEWRGSGWMMMPDGSRQAFRSHEVVTPRLSGAALLVEGKHYKSDDPERPVHDAMAMITWDSRANGFRFRSALADGKSGDFPLLVGENRFAWSMDTPGGRIEYVTSFADGVWKESGRRIAANGQATEFFQMTLKKQ